MRSVEMPKTAKKTKRLFVYVADIMLEDRVKEDGFDDAVAEIVVIRKFKPKMKGGVVTIPEVK